MTSQNSKKKSKTKSTQRKPTRKSVLPKGKNPNPQDINTLVILFNHGRYPEMETIARKMTVLFPKHGIGWKAMGTALLQQGRTAEALAPLQKAAELSQGDAQPYNNLGNAFMKLGRLAEAEASYLDALKLNPTFVEAYNNLVNALQEQGRFSEALERIRNMTCVIADQNTHESADPKTTTPIVALLPFGRSGSLFFHSLFDGHPDIATLPGIYFKGWFGHDTWERFAPNLSDPKWRDRLVGQILNEFQPLFDARSKKNVVGTPLGPCDWLAKHSGFMEMGADCSQPFIVDQKSFATALLSLLAPLSSISQKACFELIHRAFEVAIRGNTAAGSREGGQIFYHIHNPGPFEFANFLYHYPQARLLHIVRNPIQGMESWMLSETDVETGFLASLRNADPSGKLESDYLLERWNKAVGKSVIVFNQLHSPFNTLAYSRGVRLEDVKRDTKRVMPQIAAWMGIPDHPSLYEASFCGLQYWGPASNVTGKITGFDTKAIDRPAGRLLGLRDIMIFETLFWPFSHQYGYTDLDIKGFRRQLAEIRPWLDEPLEFETKLYEELPDHTRLLKELPAYTRMHCLLQYNWAALDRDGTYHGMVQPLSMD